MICGRLRVIAVDQEHPVSKPQFAESLIPEHAEVPVHDAQ